MSQKVKVSFSRGSEATMLRVEVQMYLDLTWVFQHQKKKKKIVANLRGVVSHVK